MQQAGCLLIWLAQNGILGTGKVCRNNGQASFVELPGQEMVSQPDHVLMSRAFFRQAELTSGAYQ